LTQATEKPVPDAAGFRERRERVLAQLGEDAMVLPAAPRLFRSRDAELRYRPDSELYYLTGFREPGAVLVLRGFADEGRVVLFALPRDADAERWEGPRAGPAVAGESMGADEAHPVAELAQRLPGLLADARNVHFRLGRHRTVETLVIQALQEARRKGPRTGRGPDGIVDPGRILDELRLVKSPGEVEAIRAAARVTAAGFREALRIAGPGLGEWEVEAALEAAFRREGASGPAFATIVGSGDNACVLHYVENSGRIGRDDLVLLDAGAEVEMYAADVSRTFPASGQFTEAQRAVYDVVEAAREAAVARVRPGATIRDVHEAAVDVLVTGLVDLGVLRGSMDEIRERSAHQSYFPHRTSHWLGLDTHDPGDYARDGESRRLEPGMVLTVEPGLYFSRVPEGKADGHEDLPEPGHPFTGIGVRIEDDVLVTGDGGEVLTAELPTDGDEVAALVGGA
jgi:Xaa-Pro aminopeptidase